MLARSCVLTVELVPQSQDLQPFPVPPARCSGPWSPASMAQWWTAAPCKSGITAGWVKWRTGSCSSVTAVVSTEHCIYVILLFMPLNVISGKMRGAIALRWLVATSCAQHRLCQLWHRGTCCQLSSGWKAQIGPGLASAQSLLRALCLGCCQLLAVSSFLQHVVFYVTLRIDSCLLD